MLKSIIKSDMNAFLISEGLTHAEPISKIDRTVFITAYLVDVINHGGHMLKCISEAVISENSTTQTLDGQFK